MGTVDHINPCPFCYGSGVLRFEQSGGYQRYHIQCLRCKATGPEAAIEQTAIAKWNARVKK